MALFMSTCILITVTFFYALVFTDISEAQCSSSKRYEVYFDSVTFAKALQLCNDMGAELATPLNEFEQQQIGKLVFEAAHINNSAAFVAWIGGIRCSDCNNNGKEFIWLPKGRKQVYKHYEATQPDNSKGVQNCLAERYLKVTNKVGWDDDNCSLKRNYICQMHRC